MIYCYYIVTWRHLKPAICYTTLCFLRPMSCAVSAGMRSRLDGWPLSCNLLSASWRWLPRSRKSVRQPHCSDLARGSHPDEGLHGRRFPNLDGSALSVRALALPRFHAAQGISPTGEPRWPAVQNAPLAAAILLR